MHIEYLIELLGDPLGEIALHYFSFDLNEIYALSEAMDGDLYDWVEGDDLGL